MGAVFAPLSRTLLSRALLQPCYDYTVENPKISLIIPAYNEAVCLSACLDSVAAQAEAPDEVIRDLIMNARNSEG